MVDPIVRYSLLAGPRRQVVVQRCKDLEAELVSLDEALTDLVRHRRAVVEELRRQRDRLLTTLQRRGRRPTPDGAAQLPPVHHDARFVSGRRLRAVCLALLARFGSQSLTQLHAQLHHHGYAVSNPDTVKALADALGYEHDNGRVTRIARGVYAINDTPPARVMHLLAA
jgi:hypothetical protein